MKIARAVIGAEEIRGALPMSGHATGETSLLPFAASFGESLTAIATKEGRIQEGSPAGHLLTASTEVGKQSTPDVEGEPKIPRRSPEVLTGVFPHATKVVTSEAWKQSQPEQARSLEVAEPQGSLQKRAEPQGKSNASEESPDGEELQLLDLLPVKSTISGKVPVITETKPLPSEVNNPKDDLKVVLEQNAPQETASIREASGRSGQSKDAVKVHEAEIPHKASKREKASDVAVPASVTQETPVPAEPAVSQVFALPTPAMAAPQGETKVVPLTSRDSSSSARTTAVAQPTGAKTREVRRAGEPDSSQLSKAGARTERESVDPSSEKTSAPEPGEKRAFTAPQKDESASAAAASSLEKSHLPNSTQGIAATPAHPQLVAVQPTEKAPSPHTVLANSKEPLSPGATQIYGADQHKTLVAAPTTLEVGVPDGTHGWLRVRAELAGDGAIHASVSSSSTAGTEMLRRELPSLTSYLHQEQVPVSSLVVHASSSTMDSSNLSGGGGQSQEPGRGAADTHDSTGRENGSVRYGEGTAEEEDGAGWTSSTGYAEARGWLSIRA